MKKVHLLVFKAFIKPFIVTFFIVMFILLMLFLFKYIDDLIGKGFEWYVILELLMYASATNVAMALPLAILLSSIMTFGSLGENYELVAIKSAGISLQKAMMPLIIGVSMLSVAAFLFSDYMLPIANLKMGSLLYDVRNQKAAFLIKEGIFNNSIPGYSIRVKKKDPDQTLHDVLIYERNTTSGNVNVLMAKEGQMFITDDDQLLVLKLKDGKRYEETPGSTGTYNPRQRLMRTEFKETEQKFDLSGFQLKRTDEELFKSNYAMLNLKQLNFYRDSFELKGDSNLRSTYRDLTLLARTYRTDSLNPKGPVKVIKKYKDVLEIIPIDKRIRSVQTAKDQIRSIKDILSRKELFIDDNDLRMRGFLIELNRKFTLAISCLVLFFIGAPLGAIIRKGGLGLPVVMSVLFFLLYHIISTIGEKSVKEGTLTPFIGMWIAIFTLTPLGIFLTYKATVDSALFDLYFYKRWFKRLFAKNQK
ncbi:MAG: YjgP/YjgQ family permease [Bacteroidetes bacterium]|uniref:LptF/LptG family permease n=1 Tax=Daejeonella sp. TaxID=2805397 RepID=UPI00404A47BD|nr:YjgP/YjgQ family permease [Bacteroidota bacterium]